MSLKILHISDLHIRNYRYHEEYQKVFADLYEKAKELKPDIILNTGDTVHTKLQLSPSCFDVMANLFKKLADIAPLHMILGNHDLNLRNLSKLDALTPVVDSLNHPNIHFHKYSQKITFKDKYILHVLSIVDPDNWTVPEDKSKVNIAVFHGSVKGAITDIGWMLQHGDIDIKYLQKFDYALLGDIHKANQAIDKTGRRRYSGSLIQQNFGEEKEKGALLWEIKDRRKFTAKLIELDNPRPFVTLELTAQGKVPDDVEVVEGARLRLIANNSLPLNTMKRAVDVAKTRFKPESVVYLNRAAGSRGTADEIVGEDLGNEDLRDLEVQMELIDEFLQEYQVSSSMLEKVFALNGKYNSIIEEKEEVARNINWKLKSLEWDNLFNYSEGNKVDFTKLKGIVGIFGKNFSGKSSLVDSFLYALFNSTSKRERKNLDIINQNKDTGRAKATLSIGNKDFFVERISEKYIKKLKGDETVEAKTNTEFYLYDKVTEEKQVLNGETRSETDKNIRKYVGTLDDFLLTSMASQLDSLAFISEGSTRRKEIFAKFLDLEVFDKKFKLAKEEASDLRGALKRLEGREFEEEVQSAEEELKSNERLTEEHVEKCEEYKNARENHREEIRKLENSISSIPTEVIDIKEVNKLLKALRKQIEEKEVTDKELKTNISAKESHLEKIETFLVDFDIEKIKEDRQAIKSYYRELKNIEDEIKEYESQSKIEKKKATLLKQVPCGTQFSECKFIKDAYVALNKLSITKESLKESKKRKKETSKEMESLNPEKVLDYAQKYEQLLLRKSSFESELTEMRLEKEKNKIFSLHSQKETLDLEDKVTIYQENRAVIENKEGLILDQQAIEAKLEQTDEELAQCEQETTELYKQHGSLEQKLLSLKEQEQELVDLQEQYASYDLFMRCMHSSGISYDIIKRKLPVINNEIAKVLTNVVEFEVFFEDDGKHLKIFIKHPKHDARPLAMGSGAEKTIAAMAIRLALLSVSSLPRPDLFILDEPGGALDEENMEGFVRILEIVKSYFKTVLLISHLDVLKDCVDMEITIDKRGDYAHVEVE